MFDVGTSDCLEAVDHCLPPAGSRIIWLDTERIKIRSLASMEYCCLHIFVKLKNCMLNDYDLGTICSGLHKQIV